MPVLHRHGARPRRPPLPTKSLPRPHPSSVTIACRTRGSQVRSPAEQEAGRRSYLEGSRSSTAAEFRIHLNVVKHDLLPCLFAQALGWLRCSLALLPTEPAARARIWTEGSTGFSAGGQRISPVAVCGQTPSTATGDWICSISSRSAAARTACGSSRWAGRRATRCRRVLPRRSHQKVRGRAAIAVSAVLLIAKTSTSTSPPPPAPRHRKRQG
jgi:hypothetical protein